MENLIKFKTIPSTKLYLKENFSKLKDRTIVLADHQTNGRGRLQRNWKDDDDLLFSILLKDNLKGNITNLSLLAAASIYKTLIKHLENVKIKWPNDILVNEKKISGILLESIISSKVDCVIIGIGINVNTRDFKDDLSKKATSLFLETSVLDDKESLFEELLKDFFYEYELYLQEKSDYLNICRENSYLIGKNVLLMIDEKAKDARVLNILNNGNILLLIDGKEVEMNYGEITLTGVY